MASIRRKKSEYSAQASPGNGALKTASPLVFISHDTRDADLAEAFSILLTDASGGVLQHFRSSDRKGTAGIEFGQEWYSAIMSKLSSATDVVALLTTHSLERPWILYEAGVAKGKLDTTVLGLAINIPLEKTNSGPFAQFQNCADDEDSLTKLVLQLIRRNPQASPREEAVRRQVQAFQAAVKTVTEKRAKTPHSTPKMDENSVAKMFEEVKILVRDLPNRVSEATHDLPPNKFKRLRFHPMILEEFLHMSVRQRGNSSPIILLVVFSLFRDTQPWLYELGLQLYTALMAGNTTRATRIRRDIRTASEFVWNSPLARDLVRGKEDEDAFYFLRHFTERLDEFIPRADKAKDLDAEQKEDS